MSKKIILFDGVCHFCDQSVQFILQRDKQEQFLFASLQGDAGQKLVQKYNIPNDLSSLILIDNNKYYNKSTAALRICRELSGGWKFLYAFIVLPKPIRDFFYDRIANNRYRWFGKKDSCELPPPHVRKRFL
ncbi:thiol-disulfide oxidoreductase DCC family protein [Virgibacillus chiguensis]|uniref:Predicted thiol-disulfide oxidoreductase YuxK, DCC family n=1 Tax=Virgibacillus chiguensis TaxID=411959 RepID=A0A1M5R745_9BACI|nr:thiol-disulfide oxidoreductase DCC family protein [Virgibacillus chiguensis]SHH21866.1 Predicted thiol-disulfide oxidoreductase YuxK, DCC family [Virgibacillus chiguensis]